MLTKRHYRTWRCVLFLFLVLPVAVHAQTAKDFYCSGYAKRLKHDYDGAIADYTRAIELKPDYAGAYARRGNAELMKGDTAAANADFERAIALDPNDAYGYTSRGNARRIKGDFAGALADFDRALKLNPQDTYAHLGRGLAKKSTGDLDAAIAEYTRVIEIDPKRVGAYYFRGLARHAKGDFEGAIADYDRTLELDPGDAYVYLNRGLAKKSSGKLDAAIADYDRAIELNPQHATSYTKRGSARQAKGDYDGAAADYKRAIELDPENSPRYRLALAELRFEQGKYGEAYDYVSRALPKLRDLADADGRFSDYKRARLLRFLSAQASGHLSQLAPQELLSLLREQLDFLGPWAWVVPVVVLLVLAGLMWWTYGTRQRGPGLWLSGFWIAVALLASGIGFQLALPGLNNVVGRWLGAIMVSLACFISVWIWGRERYLGFGPVFADYKASLRAAGLLVALLMGVVIAEGGYKLLYARVFGRELDAQLGQLLLHCNTPAQFAVTLLVGGLAIPFYEEVLFRGFLFDAQCRRWGAGWGRWDSVPWPSPFCMGWTMRRSFSCSRWRWAGCGCAAATSGSASCSTA
jgi:tetratricopeptide (TPR) repeat protein